MSSGNSNGNTNTNANGNAEDKREQRLQVLDDHIGRALAASAASGELRSAAGFGKPLDFGDGYAQTPAELRMGYKILRDAGVVPPEVQWMREIEALRAALDGNAADDDAARAQRRRLVDLRQQLALRLEKLRTSGTL